MMMFSRTLMRGGRQLGGSSSFFHTSSLLHNNNNNKTEEKPLTPDFTTPVNVGDIRLKRPDWEKKERLDRQREEREAATSLIPETLKEMETDEEFIATAKQLKEIGAKAMSLEERKKRRRALDSLQIPQFHEYLEEKNLEVTRKSPSILQLNIGLYCNQACSHCHVESSPTRTELMSEEVANHCLRLLRESKSVKTLDLTGGAPELSPVFRMLVEEASKMGVEIIDRCNLTVLEEPDQEDLHEFLADHKVRVVASLPCYSSKNVNMQRGKGVFDRSIRGLQKLNEIGYGQPDSGLSLDLVYNPIGAFLPPPQGPLQEKYKEELMEHFGIKFNNLLTITNMPIKRFADFLYRRGELEDYMELLVRNFNPSTTEGLMCRDTISVGWDGRIYDCDFNQQLSMDAGALGSSPTPSLTCPSSKKMNVLDLKKLDDLLEYHIVFDSHCYGCTAGAGSSCQGATV